jgi:hypothetical protein
MALHFVKTSVLTSEDGIDFGKEVAVESEEARKSRQEADDASRKPLYEQLRELQDKAKEEYDANTKRLFAAPKALDEEDVMFLNDIESTRVKAMEQRAATEQSALEAFRAARNQLVLSSSVVAREGNSTYVDPTNVHLAASSSSSSSSNHHLFVPPKKDTESFVNPVIFTKKRRKGDEYTGTGVETKQDVKGGIVVEGSSKKTKTDEVKEGAKDTTTGTGGQATSTGGAALSLLGGYGSDGDDDN